MSCVKKEIEKYLISDLTLIILQYLYFIKSIKEISINYNDDELVGFEIETNKEPIQLCINNVHNCCEVWGFSLHKFPDLPNEDYYNSHILKIKLDEKSKEVNQIVSNFSEGDYATSLCVSLSIHTSAGLLVLFVYNDHNGYYPHSYLAKYNGIEDFSEI
jgi:hypothetical protein